MTKHIYTNFYSIVIRFAVDYLVDTIDSFCMINKLALNFCGHQYSHGTHDAGKHLAVNMVQPIDSHTLYMIRIAVNTAPTDTNRYNLDLMFLIERVNVMPTHRDLSHSS